MIERLQKVLARAGIASRRACEEMITAGRVTVNGVVVTEMGTRVDFMQDVLAVDGNVVSTAPALKYIMVNKPVGYVCTTSDPQGRRTVLDLISDEDAPRLFPVGRLDTDSEGLLLMTNDGALTERLTHPRYGLEKEYLVWVDGHPTDEDLASLRAGIPLDGKPAPVDSITVVPRPHLTRSTTLLKVIVHEGRNREIRRLCDSIGYRVQRLQRVRLGPLYLGELEPGASRPLTREELLALKAPAPRVKDEAKTERVQRYPSPNKFGASKHFNADATDAGRGQRPRPPAQTGWRSERPARPDTAPARGDRFTPPDRTDENAERPGAYTPGPKAPAASEPRPQRPAGAGYKTGRGPRFVVPAAARPPAERPSRPDYMPPRAERATSAGEGKPRTDYHERHYNRAGEKSRYTPPADRAARPERAAFPPTHTPRFAPTAEAGARDERPSRPPYRPTHAPRFAPPAEAGARDERPSRPPYRPTHAPRFAPPAEAGVRDERPSRPPYRPTHAPRFAPPAPPQIGNAGQRGPRPAAGPSYRPDRSQRPDHAESAAPGSPADAQRTTFRRSNAHHAPYRVNNHDRRSRSGGEERPRRAPRR